MRSVAVLALGAPRSEARLLTDRDRIGGSRVQGTFGLSERLRREEKLLDMHLRAYRYHPLEASLPVIAGKALVNDGAAGLRRDPKSAAARLKASARPDTLRYLSWHLAGKTFRQTPFDHLRFTAFLEQEPDPDNRITLSGRHDTFGCPLPRLSNSESAFIQESTRKTLQLMATIMERRGLGRLTVEPGKLGHIRSYDGYGLHHMGATRMADDPRYGVVDRNCRVHGLKNLYIAGSSVFPTGGAANPSWTIAALALRLADEVGYAFGAGRFNRSDRAGS